jgi:hypothetical protein
MFTGCAVATAVQNLPYERQRSGRQGLLTLFLTLLDGCIFVSENSESGSPARQGDAAIPKKQQPRKARNTRAGEIAFRFCYTTNHGAQALSPAITFFETFCNFITGYSKQKNAPNAVPIRCFG